MVTALPLALVLLIIISLPNLPTAEGRVTVKAPPVALAETVYTSSATV